ncbi:unnamed protein product [Rotaria sordida]|uniref:Uncharacterized protein n=1 Tax=Rotaria sordida TaxID=392033 RepID=A0A815JVP6_9BILA|nr:unnamed protein product [Rotaria sordida]
MALSIKFIILFLFSITFIFGQYPLPPDPSLLPIPPEAHLHGSTIIFTQRALQLAPSIFRKFIDDGIQYIRDQLNQIPDISNRSGCCHSSPRTSADLYIGLSSARKTLKLVNDPILTIPDDNSLQIDAIVHISVVSEIYGRAYFCVIRTLRICATHTVCSHGSQIWLDANLHIQIRIAVENTATGAVFKPSVLFKFLNGYNKGGCNCNNLCKLITFLVRADSDMYKKAQEKITQEINDRMQPISAGGIYSPYYGIAIRYTLVSAVLRANQDVRAYISIVVYILNPVTQQWLIYQDYDRERSILYPPFEWPSPGLSLPLASLRVGSNVMNAISSAFESLGTFESNVNDIIEDVFFDEQIYWYIFKISIFRQDEALLHVDYISTNVTCQFNRFNCSNSAFDNNSTMCNISENDIQKYAVAFLSGTITNIDMNIVMLMTLVNNRPGVYLNGTYINSEKLNITIKAAPLPIPPSAEAALLKHMILRSLPIINSMLIKNPLLLPVEAIPYFPNPSSHLYPQVNKQGKNIGYGYIDITSNEMNSSIHEHKLVSHIHNTRTTTTCTTNVESIRPHPSDIASFGGIYLSIFESEYDDTIQNTNCSIAQEGFQMSSYALPTTTYINSTIWNDTCTVIAQCMDTSEFFDSNLQYYSLLQDSTTGSILALSFMCSDPECQQCQYQQNFCKENNPIEKCLLGKYFYRFNQTLFSFRITPWDETTTKTCTIKTKPTTTIIPQLDFQLVKAKTTFLLTYTNAEQCQWNITNNAPNYLSKIINLGSNLITEENIYCSTCNSDLSSSMTCSASTIEKTSYKNCYTLKAFCVDNCTRCNFDIDLVCLNFCLFTNLTIPMTSNSLLSIEDIWNSKCCLNTSCERNNSSSDTITIVIVVIAVTCVCIIITLIIVCVHKKKAKTQRLVTNGEGIPLLPKNQDEILPLPLRINYCFIITFIKNIPQWFIRIFQTVKLWFIETFKKPTKQDISIYNFTFFCCTIVNIFSLCYLASSWTKSSPFNTALDSTVDEERYGLTDKYLDNTKAIKDFYNWQSNGKNVTIVCTILMLSTFIQLFINNKKKKRFQKLLSYILSLILLSQLCLLLIPSFVYDFFRCMNIRQSSDTFIQRDPDTQSIELYCIQSIRTGVIIGYILYLLLIRKRLENIPLTILKYIHNSIPTKTKIIQALADADYVRDWPPDSEGGSLFDGSFKKLDGFLHCAVIFYLVGTLLLCLILIFDWISYKRKSKARKWLVGSQMTSFFALIVIFIAVILPSVPNYVEAANLSTVCQKCGAPKFDELIQKMFGGVIGTAAQVYLLLNLFPVLLSISPTAIRVATLSLNDLSNYYEKRLRPAMMKVNKSDDDDNDDYENHTNPRRSDTIAYEEKSRQLLRLIYLSVFISPILIALPLSLIYQILRYQDISSSLPTTLGVLIAAFILVPIFLELPMTTTIKTYKTNYYLYLLAYIGIFIGIVGYLYTLKPLQSIIAKELKSPEFYLTLIAEISVSNVIFGNLISFCIKF